MLMICLNIERFLEGMCNYVEDEKNSDEILLYYFM